MREDGQQTSGPRVQFVWEALDGMAKVRRGSGRRSALRRRALLIGSGGLALLAGAIYAAGALGAPQHHATTGAAAVALPSSLIPAPGAVSKLPTGPRPGLSRSASPQSHAAAAVHKVAPVAQYASSAAARTSSAAQQQPPATHQQPSTSTSTVASPTPIGDWPLSTPVSGSNSVADIAGSDPGTPTNVQWGTASGVGGYSAFNGTNSLISTTGPAVDTGPGRSYTVSAWLDPIQYDTSAFMTAVSQDGGPEGNSAFYLMFSGPVDRWVFLIPGASAPATSAGAPALNTWTHVVGVYDAAYDQVRLYVNGALDGTATYDSTYAASTGGLVIGRAMYGGGICDWFPGHIRDVQVFDQALTTSAVDNLG